MERVEKIWHISYVDRADKLHKQLQRPYDECMYFLLLGLSGSAALVSGFVRSIFHRHNIHPCANTALQQHSNYKNADKLTPSPTSSSLSTRGLCCKACTSLWLHPLPILQTTPPVTTTNTSTRIYSINQPVIIRLKWGQTEYRGTLVSVDSYMNIQLSGTAEYIDGKETGSLGMVLIRYVP